MAEHPGPGWYHAGGDPPGTHRYWDGERWVGGAQPVPPVHGVSIDGQGHGRFDVAGPWRRLWARFVDFALAAALAIAVAAAVGLSDSTLSPGAEVGLVLAGFGAYTTYEALMIAARGATLGKAVLGLRVVDQRSGERPGFARAWARASLTATWMNTVVMVLNAVWVFSDPHRRSAFDRLGRTYVVRAGPP